MALAALRAASGNDLAAAGFSGLLGLGFVFIRLQLASGFEPSSGTSAVSEGPAAADVVLALWPDALPKPVGPAAAVGMGILLPPGPAGSRTKIP